MSEQPHTVILGGGFGGLSAARALVDAPVRVTVVDRQNHHLFQPLLYQVATAALSPGDIASPIRWVLRRHDNTRVVLGEATAIDTGQRVIQVRADDRRRSLDYDYLIVATGATHAYFGHDEWRETAPGLKTLADALRIRQRVLLAFERAEQADDSQMARRLLTFVVIGGGPTSVELAGALAEVARHALAHDFRAVEPRAAKILLVEAAPAILGSFPAPLRLVAERSLRRLGVEIRTNAAVRALGNGWVDTGDDPDRIEAGTILWAAGVAASPLGRTLGVPVDEAGRVLIESDLSVPGHPEVFVVGDLAAFLHQTGAPLPGVAPVAIQQARHAADTIRRALAGQPSRPFRYRSLGNLATVGRGSAIADFGWFTLSGTVAWLAWLFVHIWNLIGFRNKIVVMTQWAWSYLTYQRSVRVITQPDE